MISVCIKYFYIHLFVMAKPKFYLEPRITATGDQAINMFYSFAGQRLQYYTGIRINPKYFRPECNKSDVIQPLKTTHILTLQVHLLKNICF